MTLSPLRKVTHAPFWPPQQPQEGTAWCENQYCRLVFLHFPLCPVARLPLHLGRTLTFYSGRWNSLLPVYVNLYITPFPEYLRWGAVEEALREWSSEWICIVHMGVAISRTPRPQTHRKLAKLVPTWARFKRNGKASFPGPNSKVLST